MQTLGLIITIASIALCGAFLAARLWIANRSLRDDPTDKAGDGDACWSGWEVKDALHPVGDGQAKRGRE